MSGKHVGCAVCLLKPGASCGLKVWWEGGGTIAGSWEGAAKAWHWLRGGRDLRGQLGLDGGRHVSPIHLQPGRPASTHLHAKVSACPVLGVPACARVTAYGQPAAHEMLQH